MMSMKKAIVDFVLKDPNTVSIKVLRYTYLFWFDIILLLELKRKTFFYWKENVFVNLCFTIFDLVLLSNVKPLLFWKGKKKREKKPVCDDMAVWFLQTFALSEWKKEQRTKIIFWQFCSKNLLWSTCSVKKSKQNKHFVNLFIHILFSFYNAEYLTVHPDFSVSLSLH